MPNDNEKIIVLRKIFNEEDPIGIYFGEENQDEYDPEISRILQHLKSCVSEEEVLNLIYSIFIEYFDKNIVGEKEKYRTIAEKIYRIYKTQ